MNAKASSILFLAGAIFLASSPAAANTVLFDGYQFSSLYGPENLTINGSNNLLVPTTSNNFGGATTPLPVDAFAATTSFLDSGLTTGPAAELWVQDFTSTVTYEAALGAFTGHADYFVLYRVDGGSISQFIDTGVARSAGTHTVSIEELANGTVDFLLDSALVETASAAQFGIPVLGDVVLTANGDATGEQATFTSFSVTTPEPSPFLCLTAALVVFAFRAKRRSA
jgi:hypothetical protein